MARPYASAGLTLSWNGIDIGKGFNGIELTMNGNLTESSWDLRGKKTTSQLANQGAQLSIEYVQTEAILEDLDAAAANLQLMGEHFPIPTQGVLVFNDPLGTTGKFVAWDVSLISTGDETWSEVVGSRSILFDCEKLIRTNDPASVLANIAQYVLD